MHAGVQGFEDNIPRTKACNRANVAACESTPAPACPPRRAPTGQTAPGAPGASTRDASGNDVNAFTADAAAAPPSGVPLPQNGAGRGTVPSGAPAAAPGTVEQGGGNGENAQRWPPVELAVAVAAAVAAFVR